MPSTVTWLDASVEDQRRMREIINLFSTRDSRDELGIGQVRDALSDLLFPGTSVLLQRARYLLLVPWCFVAAASASTIEKARVAADRNERSLIQSLRREGYTEGLIGRDVGIALKVLPSVIYGTPMRQWGILTAGVRDATDALARSLEARKVIRESDDGNLDAAGWISSLPRLPDRFPETSAGGFDLTWKEANWLKLRIQAGAPDTLLSELLDRSPDAASSAAWRDPAAMQATGRTLELLDNSRLFSLIAHGAALQYNLLLAREYEAEGFDRIDAPTQRYEELVANWRDELGRSSREIDAWDLGEFWSTVRSQNHNLSESTVAFVTRWVEWCRTTPNDGDRAATMLRTREERQKGPQRRLGNRRVLASWQGASGSGELTFRWAQVKRIVLDIHAGLERDDA